MAGAPATLSPQSGAGVWDARLNNAPELWSRSFADDEVAALGAAADAVLAASTPSASTAAASPAAAAGASASTTTTTAAAAAAAADAVADPASDLSLVAVDAAAAALAPAVLARLRALRDAELLRGRGFFVLRGLPVAAWGDAKAAAAFLVLSRALGALRQQNGAGHVLGHVTDLGLSSADPSVRVYQTSERQSFHTDSCDVVGLLMLRPAARGGDSFLVSAGAVFNELLRGAVGGGGEGEGRGDSSDGGGGDDDDAAGAPLDAARGERLARRLLEPLATDRRGEVPAGQQPFFLIPVLSLHDEGLLSVI